MMRWFRMTRPRVLILVVLGILQGNPCSADDSLPVGNECDGSDVVVVGHSKVLFDGYYDRVDPIRKDVFDTMRFYPDGRVVGTPIIRQSVDDRTHYRAISGWLRIPLSRESPFNLMGKYQIDGSKISINLGNVDYQGTIARGVLILDSHSHINGVSLKGDRYSFHPIPR